MVQPLQLLPQRRDGGNLLPPRGRLAARGCHWSGGRRDGGRLHPDRRQPHLAGRRTLAGARTFTGRLGIVVAPAAGSRPDHGLDGRPYAGAHAGGGALDGPGHRRPAVAGTNGSFRSGAAAAATVPTGEGPRRLKGDMADLPRAARLYLGAVLATASLAAVIGIAVAPPRIEMAPVALVLLGCATVAQQFKVRSPKHQSYYTTTIFFFAAALLLHPGYVVVIILTAHGVELLRVRYRWYIQAFNVANFLLCSMAAGALFNAGLQGNPVGGARSALFALLAGLVFVGLNHLLTALVIMWARGVPISRAGTMDWDNLGTDLALMSVGALGSLLWLTNPWLVPLCLGPLFLIYRSLLVPSLKEEARTDPKTELANMKHWNEVARAEVERARRFRRPLTVVLADLDLLRDINNRHGHLTGDQMIRRVADAIRGALREYDVPARFGGDEFAILMPETTLAEAMTVAERVRRGVEAIALKLSDGLTVGASVSIGVAQLPGHGRTASELLAAADRAVYQAKALGRNRVCAFTERESDTVRPIRIPSSPRREAS
ncbi:MAG: GGDEF domain-containing protein [Chloroflexi bacterium]|nr:MAG: GGDEF domain-containing protein [Chloroflexota bacterium]